MTQKPQARLHLQIPGLSVELSGNHRTVENLCQTISKDLAAHHGQVSATDPSGSGLSETQRHLWVYLCTAYLNKVYLVEDSYLERGKMGRFLDTAQIRRVYLDSKESARYAGLSREAHTMWAEFTAEGRNGLGSLLDQ